MEQRTGNHTRQLWAQVLLAQVLYQTGEFAPAYENFLQAEVEACFWKAITLARHQRAASLELRAVLSLSWLWRQQGKVPQARQMLAQMYGRFTEGFDTMDLQEA